MLMDWTLDPLHVEKVAKTWNNYTEEQRLKFMKSHNINPLFYQFAKKKFDKLPEIVQGLVLTHIKPIL